MMKLRFALLTFMLIPLFAFSACDSESEPEYVFEHSLPEHIEVDNRAFFLLAAPRSLAEETVARYFLYAITQDFDGMREIFEDCNEMEFFEDGDYPLLYVVEHISTADGWIPWVFRHDFTAHYDLFEYAFVSVNTTILGATRQGLYRGYILVGRTDDESPWKIHQFHYRFDQHGSAPRQCCGNLGERAYEAEADDEFYNIDQWLWDWGVMSINYATRAAGRYILYSIDQATYEGFDKPLHEVLGNPGIHEAHLELILDEHASIEPWQPEHSVSLGIHSTHVITCGVYSDLYSVSETLLNTLTLLNAFGLPDWQDWAEKIKQYELLEYALVSLNISYMHIHEPVWFGYIFDRVFLVGRTAYDDNWKVYELVNQQRFW